MKSQKYINILITILLFTIISINLFLLINTIFRGFNFSDEGFYLLMTKHPDDVIVPLNSSYYLYANLLYRLAHQNIILLKIFSILLNFITSLILYYSFTKHFNIKERKYFVIFFLYFIILIFIGNAWLIVPNYNNLLLYTLNLQLALLISIFSNTHKLNYKLFIFGLLLGQIFFIKFPAAIIEVLIFIPAMAVINNKNNHSSLVKILIFVIFGIFSYLVFYFLCIQSLQSWIHGFNNGLIFNKLYGGGHDFGIILHYMYELTIMLIKIIIIFGLYVLITSKFKTRPFIHEKVIFYFTLIASIIIIYKTSSIATSQLILNPYCYSMLLMLLYLNRSVLNIRTIPIQQIILYSIIILAPFICSIGTANNITFQIILYFISFFILLMHQVYLNKNAYLQYSLAILIISIGVITAKTMAFTPYSLYDTLFNQNKQIQIDSAHLFVDSNTYNIIETTRSALNSCGYHENDFLISLYDGPGLVFALNGRSPSCPWYLLNGSGADKSATFCLSQIESATLQKSFIFINNLTDISKSRPMPIFPQDKNLNFQDNWEICKTVEFNIVDNGVGGSKLKIKSIDIYKPRSISNTTNDIK